MYDFPKLHAVFLEIQNNAKPRWKYGGENVHVHHLKKTEVSFRTRTSFLYANASYGPDLSP